MQEPSGLLATDPLIPPDDMLFDGSSNAEEFVAFSEGFCRRILIERAQLGPADVILDIGCGNGAIARALTKVLTQGGRYEGIDINRSSVEWLQDRYQPFPGFRFTHANVLNRMYNPQGDVAAGEYRLPFPDGTFSVVLLKSVFTHMIPSEVRHYVGEVSRVLRTNGRLVATFFLLNAEAQQFIDQNAAGSLVPVDLPGDPLCRIGNLALPEQVVAHDEARIRTFCRECDLTVSEMIFGNWCGRPSMLGMQDVVIAIKN